MLNVPTIIAIFGGILFLLGLIGGGFEVKGTKMPPMSAIARILSFFMGLGFLSIATWLSLLPEHPTFSSSPTKSSATVATTNTPTQTTAAITPNSVMVTIASSSTKQQWMEQMATRFQAEGKTTRQGKKIIVQVQSVSSGGSTEDLLAGKLKPVVWSPGSDSWVEQFNNSRQQQSRQPINSQPCQPVIYTPLGFAMWRPMAEALGWPDRPIGWKTIVELASDPKGWERYGHPEWGKFYFGHAHPKYGNSGLLAMTSFVYGIVGKTTTLTVADVYSPAVETALRTLAQNTAKYGVVAEDLIELMIREGAHYLHAIVTYESEAIRPNLTASANLRFPIAFVLPAEGTFWGNHPYCILDKAEWINSEQVEAAQLFRDYLLHPTQQALAVDSLMRPLDLQVVLHEPLTLANGTDPRVTPKTIPPLAVPNAEVSAAIIDLFMITKRKATIIIALDTSGSMEGEKIRSATNATAEFLKRLQVDDRIGILTFSNQVNTLSKIVRVGDVVEELPNRIKTLLAKGSTALYEAICEATRLTQEQRTLDAHAQENRLYGIVLLSDGDDTAGRPTENQMFATCLPASAEVEGVKIFPIAFGSSANQRVLKRIAEATGGTPFTATPESIAKAYLKISAEQ